MLSDGHQPIACQYNNHADGGAALLAIAQGAVPGTEVTIGDFGPNFVRLLAKWGSFYMFLLSEC